MRLYTPDNKRLYINADELERFLAAADRVPLHIKRFAYFLAHTGCRISEARELRTGALQTSSRVVSIRTLKRRDESVIREVPMPHALCPLFENLDAHPDEYLWPGGWGEDDFVSRTTATRWIKDLMAEAGIEGPQACPKGLRHGFGVRAVIGGVQLNVLQLWMGHASMETTAIYATVIGREALLVSDRMWSQ